MDDDKISTEVASNDPATVFAALADIVYRGTSADDHDICPCLCQALRVAADRIRARADAALCRRGACQMASSSSQRAYSRAASSWAALSASQALVIAS